MSAVSQGPLSGLAAMMRTPEAQPQVDVPVANAQVSVTDAVQPQAMQTNPWASAALVRQTFDESMQFAGTQLKASWQALRQKPM